MTRSCSSRWVVSDRTRVADSGTAFDVLIFIGRFQPFHQGHLHVVQRALALAPHLVILCGSARQPRSTRNPWTVAERTRMIHDALAPADQARVHIEPLADVLYDDDAWIREVRLAVKAGIARADRRERVGLIGHDKDSTSYYLDLFPEWELCAVENYQGISATPIREQLLRHPLADPQQQVRADAGDPLVLQEALPAGVLDFLRAFAGTTESASLQQEQQFLDEYRASWSAAPYPPFLVTADALVTCNRHVLLIERGGMPGRGLWALPGGFVNRDETLAAAGLRELIEETGLDAGAPETDLQATCIARRVFDEPTRSARGRTITQVSHFALAGTELPVLQAADDARAAFWVPLAGLPPERMFEDHYFILRAMLGADALYAGPGTAA